MTRPGQDAACSGGYTAAESTPRASLSSDDSSSARRTSIRMAWSLILDAPQAGQAVDAGAVLLPLVGFHALRPLPLGVGRQQLPLACELEQRHAVSARISDPLQLDHDDRADAGVFREEPDESVPLLAAWLDGLPLAAQSKDPGRPAERTKQDRDAAVLAEVGDGLDAAAWTSPGMVDTELRV